MRSLNEKGTVASKLRTGRAAFGHTQEQAAKILKMCRPDISNIENGLVPGKVRTERINKYFEEAMAEMDKVRVTNK